jgi:Protein of unknown function (DUF3237)
MTIATRELLVLEAVLDAPQMVEATPYGLRKIVPVLGGTFTGDRLNGVILPTGGHDWAMIRADGALVLDVRLVLETDDGAHILMTYRGIRTGTPEVLTRIASGEYVDPADYYFRIVPFFETGSETYAWLNSIVCVGFGDRVKAGPRYTVHEVL